MPRYKTTRKFFIPQNPSLVITDEEAKAVIYFSTDVRNRPCAVGFGGKRQKPDFNYFFKDQQAAYDYAEKYLEGQRKTARMKAERRKAQKEFRTSLEVGDILYTSWGYEQTNVDWYQVVEVKSAKTVVIREICGESVEDTGWMCGYTMPLKGRFVKDSEPMTKRVRKGDAITVDSVRNAYKWDGKRKYWSSYA